MCIEISADDLLHQRQYLCKQNKLRYSSYDIHKQIGLIVGALRVRNFGLLCYKFCHFETSRMQDILFLCSFVYNCEKSYFSHKYVKLYLLLTNQVLVDFVEMNVRIKLLISICVFYSLLQYFIASCFLYFFSLVCVDSSAKPFLSNGHIPSNHFLSHF